MGKWIDKLTKRVTKTAMEEVAAEVEEIVETVEEKVKTNMPFVFGLAIILVGGLAFRSSTVGKGARIVQNIYYGSVTIINK